MPDHKTIMAVGKNGNEITAGDLLDWMQDRQLNKSQLSEFIYFRLYGRYIQPFEFNDTNYKKSYKNGFTIMANCCLLIETYASFREKMFKDTHGKSEKCFGWFFLTESDFGAFSKGGLALNDYLSVGGIKNKGMPRDFYRNVRCGILHNGETRNGWKILRKGQFFDEKNKTINAVVFMKKLKTTLDNYRSYLDAVDVNSAIWDVYIDRLDFLISRI